LIFCLCTDGQWYRFDDSRVTPFEVEDLGSETFGGFDEALDLDASGGPVTRSQASRAPAGSIQGLANNLQGTSGAPAPSDNSFKVEKERNAYLLFYQRVEPSLPVNDNNVTAGGETKLVSSSGSNGNGYRDRAEGEIERPAFKSLLPAYLQTQQQQIWANNLQVN
jgi:hypothetical protein